MKLSNDVEKYEIEVTKMGQNYCLIFLLQCACLLSFQMVILSPDPPNRGDLGT